MKDLKLIVNDVHLRQDNIELVQNIMLQAAENALELGLPSVTVAGDFFDTRASQKLGVLKAFHQILDDYQELGLMLELMHGNHDLSSYTDTYSWITPFQDHEALLLIDRWQVVGVDGFSIAYLPFQDEAMMIESLKEMPAANVLIGHLELNGSKSHGIEATGRAISASILSKYDLVLLGHYHDEHWVTDSIYHMPAAYQHNFAEDTVKGFTVLSDDLTIRHIQADFRQYETLTLNVDEDVSKDVRKLLKMAENEDKNIRVKLEGSQASLNSFKQDKLKLAGVDVKVNHEKIYNADTKALREMRIEKVNVDDAFKAFCEKEKISLEEGLKFLKED
jgi:DNA repair exonuclease SbcCD nuclease subunit